MRELAALLVALFALCVFAVYAGWAVHDARRRGKNPLLVLIAVVAFFPFGLVAWILFRPALLRVHPSRPAPVLQRRAIG